MKRICLVIILAIWVVSVFSAPDKYIPGDSTGVKKVEGAAFIEYKMSSGETVYSVSRKYGVPYASIVSANPGVDLNAVKAGQKILVPTHFSTAPSGENESADDRKTEIIYHTVAGGETMYSIARQYNVAFKDLMAVNPEIQNYAIKTGQKIKIPAAENNNLTERGDQKIEQQHDIVIIKKDEPAEQDTQPVKIIPAGSAESKIIISETAEANTEKSLPAEKTDQEAHPAITSTTDISSSTLPVTDKNKPFSATFTEYTYTTNLISSSEKGVATWIEGSNDLSTQNERYYALHNTAPIGSVIKIRNLMNNRVIYAKVIGTLTEDEVNQKVMVKLSAGAAQKLNVLDNRFVVEATYFEAKNASASSK